MTNEERRHGLHNLKAGDQVLLVWDRWHPENGSSIEIVDYVLPECDWIKLVGFDVAYDRNTGLRHSFGAPVTQRLEPVIEQEPTND